MVELSSKGLNGADAAPIPRPHRRLPAAGPDAHAGPRTLVGAMTTQTSAPQPVSRSAAAPRTYDVRTHGCQMNVHDSERLAGLLETAGYVDVNSRGADRPDAADVVVLNTCAVRENADNKLYGNLGQLRPAKVRNPD